MSSPKSVSSAAVNVAAPPMERATTPTIPVRTEDDQLRISNINERRRHSEIIAGISTGHVSAHQTLSAMLSQKIAARMKLVKVTGLAVLAYVLCWGPYQGLGLVDIICITRHGRQSSDCKATVQWYWLQGLIMLNACLNPIIYQFNTRKQQVGNSGRLKMGRKNSRGNVKMEMLEPRHRRYMDRQLSDLSNNPIFVTQH